MNAVYEMQYNLNSVIQDYYDEFGREIIVIKPLYSILTILLDDLKRLFVERLNRISATRV